MLIQLWCFQIITSWILATMFLWCTNGFEWTTKWSWRLFTVLNPTTHSNHTCKDVSRQGGFDEGGSPVFYCRLQMCSMLDWKMGGHYAQNAMRLQFWTPRHANLFTMMFWSFMKNKAWRFTKRYLWCWWSDQPLMLPLRARKLWVSFTC